MKCLIKFDFVIVKNCARNCRCFARSAKLTACATSVFLAALSTNWLNFILSMESVRSLRLYMPSCCAVKSARVKRFSISSSVNVLT